MAAADQKELQDAVDQQMKGAVTVIVFGASGDLAGKKTYPALYNLYRTGFMPKDTHVIGYARSHLDHDEYIRRITAHIKNKDKEKEFIKMTDYVSGKYDEDESFQKLNKHIEELEKKRGLKPGQKNRIFYMALPPSVFEPVAEGLRKFVYGRKEDGHSRIVIEKPFGKDTESCTELLSNIKRLFAEDEVYRIDHYLGKEMVKNIMTLRFANMFLRPMWCSESIDNVQITLKEPFGTEGRGGYFDEYNIIRDVMQNHLLQVLSLIAMEKPKGSDPESIRDAKVELLRCVQPIKLHDTLLGQYVAANGKPGYKDDDTVPKDSICPTFAAMVLFINNKRWKDVPFIMKAGKALDNSKVEVRIQFKDMPSGLYEEAVRNELVIRIQPDEAMYFKFNSKNPGLSKRVITTDLDLTYKDRYKDMRIPDAYETLILDVLRSDHANFVRDDELDAAWKIFTPLLHQIDRDHIQPHAYPYGSRGPEDLDSFCKRYGVQRKGDVPYEWPVQSLAK